MLDAERNYTTTKLECLAVTWAIKKYREYLEGYHFTVITDNASLKWLHNLKNPTGRLARWSLSLLEYDFDIIYRKESSHHVPDALSRMYENSKEQINLIQNVNSSWCLRLFIAVRDCPEKFPNWEILDNKLYHFSPDPIISSLDKDLNEWKLVPTDEERNNFLFEAHNDPQSGHLGTEKTYKRIATNYFWPGCFKDVSSYVKKCENCQRCKVDEQAPTGLMGHKIIEEPWLVVAADIMGSFSRSQSGFQYILVIQDLFTKWIECVPFRSATGKKIKDSFLELLINRWGTPRVIHADNDTEFINNELKSLAKEFNIVHTTSPPYHPQANPVERVNRVLKTMIVSFIGINHRSWHEHLSDFKFAYNTAFHSSLKISPAFLNLGRDPKPINSIRKSKENIDSNIDSKTIEL